ncbi:glycosyltransferase [Malaciobacter mytili]
MTGLNDGGAEAVLYRLCKHDYTNDIYVISLMDEGKYGSLLNELGIDIFTLNMLSGKIKLKDLINLYKLIKKINPDVVQTWMYHADFLGGILSRLAGVRNIIWGVHNTTLEKKKSKRLTILIAKINAIISKFIPRKIIYCAEKSQEVQEKIGFDKTKGVVVRNGYNTDDFNPNKEYFEQFRKELNIKKDDFIIGHVGRYDPHKDYPNLISSLSILKKQKINFYLILVGTNLDNNNLELKSLIKENELIDCTILLGKRNDIPVIMNGFDLFVLSSSAEAFPNVLAEAMACGTPCVSTDVGDVSYIIDKTGWVVAPQNSTLLGEAIKYAYLEKSKNNKNWQDKKNMARKHIVNNFNINHMVDRYNQVWFSDK